MEWSGAQSELASLYLKRIRGRRGENLETAIAALERAADVLRNVQSNGPTLIKGLGGGSAPVPGSTWAGGSGGDVKTLHATVVARALLIHSLSTNFSDAAFSRRHSNE